MTLPPLILDFTIDDDRWNALIGAQDTIEKSVKLAYENGWQNGAKNKELVFPEQTPHVEISVVLCDDGDIQNLNRDYRGKDSPTNVLSFAMMDGDDTHMPMVDGMPPMLGDIILSIDTIAKESQQQNKPILSHLSHLSIHGTLHLLGYDHIDDSDATTMENLEVTLLQNLGINDPYAPIDD